MPATLPIPANTSIRSLHSGDVDGDGTADLVATFAPGPKDPTSSAVLVCQMNSSGIPSGCVDLAPKGHRGRADDDRLFLDAAPGRLGYRDPSMTPALGVDLLVLCPETCIDAVSRDQDRRRLRGDRALPCRRLARCDRDWRRHRRRRRRRLGLEGESRRASLVVFPQCTSRDAATCRAHARG